MSGAVAAGSVGEALTSAREALRAAGVDSPSLDSELLLAEATGRDRAALAAHPEEPVDAAAARRFGAMVRRRLQREPLAYITGRRGFRRIELAVDGRVLIPRPETELLVELALEREPATLLDVGTGSGAVALACAEELSAVEVTATDVSEQALALARLNAERLGLTGRVSFVSGSLPAPGSSFDLVLANLPYVPEGDWAGLAPEISRYEPRGALLSGADGLDAIRALVRSLAPRSGTIATAAVGLEIGHGQGAAVAALLERAGFVRAEVRADLAGLQRCVVAEAPG